MSVIWDVKRGHEMMQARRKGLKSMGGAVYVRLIDGEKDGKGLKLMAAAKVSIIEYGW